MHTFKINEIMTVDNCAFSSIRILDENALMLTLKFNNLNFTVDQMVEQVQSLKKSLDLKTLIIENLGGLRDTERGGLLYVQEDNVALVGSNEVKIFPKEEITLAFKKLLSK